MSDAWGVSWGSPSAWAASWALGVTPPVVVTTPAVGHGKHRRRVIIDDVIYEGTDAQIEEHLRFLLSQKKPRIAVKPQPKPERVELKAEPTIDLAPVVRIDMSRYERLIEDSYRHEDAFMRATLRAILKRYEDDEDDIEVLLLSL